MLSAGAYSKKFQRLEKEHMRQLEETSQLAIRTAREKAIALSKQTAQRQRAMEERKKAAIEAEEQRRKKALEERRRAQLEATERFKVVVGKLKTAPKKPKSKDVDVYQSNKAANESSSAQNNPFSRAAPERVALGSEVEVLPQKRGSHQRVSSLDDILRSVSSHDPVQSSGSNINITDYDGGVTQQLQPPSATDRMVHAKSASDSNLTSHTRQNTAISLQSCITTPLRAFSPLLEEEASLAEEGRPVAHCATGPARSHQQPGEVRVISPDSDEGDCISPDGSLSANLPLHDSLDLTGGLPSTSGEELSLPNVQAPPTALQAPSTVQAPPPTVQPPAVLSAADGVTTGDSHNLNEKFPAASTPVVELKCSYYNSVPCFVVDTADEDGSDSSSVVSACPPTKKSLVPSGHNAGVTLTGESMPQSVPAPPPPKLVGILKKPSSKLQLALPVEQSARRPSVSVKKVRFSDQGVYATLDDCNELFASPLRVSQGHINTRMLNGTMSPLPPSYMIAPKIRLLLNQTSGYTKASNGVASTMQSVHSASNGEAEPSKGELSLESHAVKSKTLDNARPEVGKAPELKVQSFPKEITQETKTFDPQIVKNTYIVERPPVAGSVPADHSPTDEDINRVWTQIRSYVQDRHRITGCVTLPEQSSRQGGGGPHVTGGLEQRTGVIQSREPELSHRAPGPPKQLTQRPSNRPLRVETVSGHDWKTRGFSKMPASLGDPQLSVIGGTPLGAHNTLSMEEQKVMQSLEKLNQRLVDHNAAVFSTLVTNDNSRLAQSELRVPYITQNGRTKNQGTQKVKTGKPTYPDYTNMASIRHK